MFRRVVVFLALAVASGCTYMEAPGSSSSSSSSSSSGSGNNGNGNNSQNGNGTAGIDSIAGLPSSFGLSSPVAGLCLATSRKLSPVAWAKGAVVDTATFTYTSSASSVASVDGQGTVTGVSPGTAIVTVTTGSVSRAVTVSVTACGTAPTGPTSITIVPPHPTIAVGDSVVLVAVPAPAGSATSVSWSSGAGCATVYMYLGVDALHEVVHGQAAGTCIITAQAPNGVSGADTVTVTSAPPVSISGGPPNGQASICPGNPSTYQLIASVNGVSANGTWSSTNPTVASVSSSGLLTPHGAGTVTISFVTSTGSTATLQLTFTANCNTSGRVDSVKVTPPSASLIVGGGSQGFVAQVYTTGTVSSTAVTWSASNPSCLNMSPNGNSVNVSAAKGCGAVQLTATAVADQSKSGSATITTSSGTVTCRFVSSIGEQSDGLHIILRVGDKPFLSGSCTNQFGIAFVPWWESSVPTTFGIIGSDTTVMVGNPPTAWPGGFHAQGQAYNTGTATITMHASIVDQTVLFQQAVTVNPAPSGNFIPNDNTGTELKIWWPKPPVKNP